MGASIVGAPLVVADSETGFVSVLIGASIFTSIVAVSVLTGASGARVVLQVGNN